LKANLALTIWSLVIAVSSLIPIQSTGPEWIPQLDKLIHVISYAILAFLALLALRSKSQKGRFWLVIICVILYGILIECAQAMANTGRYFEYFDIIANIIGSLIGSLIFFQISKN